MTSELVTMADLQKIAHLARLDFNESNLPAVGDFQNILSMIQQIENAETQHIAPMAHPIQAAAQPLRDDCVTEPNVKGVMQSLTPHTMAGLYLVPKVVE